MAVAENHKSCCYTLTERAVALSSSRLTFKSSSLVAFFHEVLVVAFDLVVCLVSSKPFFFNLEVMAATAYNLERLTLQAHKVKHQI